MTSWKTTKYSSLENSKKNNPTGQKKIKAKLNLMELKAQTKILEDKITHYKTKYQEVDQELITEIRELCPIETQPFLKGPWEKTAKKRKKNQGKSWAKKLHC